MSDLGPDFSRSSSSRERQLCGVLTTGLPRSLAFTYYTPNRQLSMNEIRLPWTVFEMRNARQMKCGRLPLDPHHLHEPAAPACGNKSEKKTTAKRVSRVSNSTEIEAIFRRLNLLRFGRCDPGEQTVRAAARAHDFGPRERAYGRVHAALKRMAVGIGSRRSCDKRSRKGLVSESLVQCLVLSDGRLVTDKRRLRQLKPRQQRTCIRGL